MANKFFHHEVKIPNYGMKKTVIHHALKSTSPTKNTLPQTKIRSSLFA